MHMFIYCETSILATKRKKPLMNDVNSRSSTGALRKYRLPDHGPRMGATNLEARLLVSELRSLFWVRNLALVLSVVRHKQDLLNLGSKETYAGTCASATASWQPTCPWDCIHIYIYSLWKRNFVHACNDMSLRQKQSVRELVACN